MRCIVSSKRQSLNISDMLRILSLRLYSLPVTVLAVGGGSGGLFQEYREPLGVGRLADGWFVGIGLVRYLLDSSAIRGDLMRHDCPIADNWLPA